jgi:hypothetical protein
MAIYHTNSRLPSILYMLRESNQANKAKKQANIV